jgi:pyruvate dehydrogenase E2 component (dihydrolipoamide acetyltransferase)
MPAIELEVLENPSSFRKIAAVAWKNMHDASVYGHLPLDAEPLEAWIAAERERTGQRVSFTHCVARAIAVTLKRNPDANCMVRGGRLYRRKQVDVFLQVALNMGEDVALGKADLSGVVIRNADQLAVHEIESTLKAKVAKLRAGKDAAFSKTKSLTDRLPPWLLRHVLKLVDRIQYDWNLKVPWLGIPPDPFGGAAVSSVGMLNVPWGYAPFFPFGRICCQLCVSSVREEPVVRDGKVEVGRILHVTVTFDHRVLDGVQAARLCHDLQSLLLNPETLNNTP